MEKLCPWLPPLRFYANFVVSRPKYARSGGQNGVSEVRGDLANAVNRNERNGKSIQTADIRINLQCIFFDKNENLSFSEIQTSYLEMIFYIFREGSAPKKGGI